MPDTDRPRAKRVAQPTCLNPPVQFHLGGEFYCGGRRWRCTDIGTRVIVAICIDGFTTGGTTSRPLSAADAAHEGWFNGPPYAVAETVFDEYDQPGCTLVVTAGDELDCG
jgi:hypothetical protein